MWNNFRFIEKLQRYYRQFLYCLVPNVTSTTPLVTSNPAPKGKEELITIKSPTDNKKSSARTVPSKKPSYRSPPKLNSKSDSNDDH